MARAKKKMKGSATINFEPEVDPNVADEGKTESERIDDERALRKAQAQQKIEEEEKKREEKRRQQIQQRFQDEERYSKINMPKIMNKWREIMRAKKVEELKDSIEVLSQSHEREVDRKDAIVSTLDRDVEESDEQYQVSLRAHLHNMQALIDLHNTRLSEADIRFEAKLADLLSEFQMEGAKIESQHNADKEELENIMAAMEDAFTRQEGDARQDFTTLRDEIKNKNSEEFSALRITLEGQIDDLERHFENAHQSYVANTEQRTQTFRVLTAKDQQAAKTIEAQLRRLHRLQESIQHWKTKMTNNVRECKDRNMALKEEKDAISAHFQELKGRMSKFRQGQSRRLTEMTVNSNAAIDSLQDKLVVAERILKLGELCRKLETEQEKVLPFESTEDSPIQEHATLVLKDTLPGIADMAALDNFFARENKALIDKLVLERERAALEAENRDLKQLVQAYLDGVTVTPDAVDGDNSLLIVNGRTNAPIYRNADMVETTTGSARVRSRQRN